MRETPGVYFIRSDSGQIKIGYSTHPGARLRGLQTSTVSKLTLLRVVEGGPELENKYHAQFAAHRIRGEWFEEVKALEPRLADLEEEIRGHTARNQNTPKYCANAFRYGYPHVQTAQR